MKAVLNFFIFLALIQFSKTIYAEYDQSRWSISGFGSFGASGTDTRQIGFKRDISEAEDVTKSWGITTDSRLGIQLDGYLNQYFQIAAQWVARDHGGDFIEQNLDWAFLRWTPREDIDVRLGRLGLDVFLLSDYRNVGYAYPWMRPPHEFYSILSLFHFDGMDVTKKFNFSDGEILKIKLFSGYSYNELPISNRTIVTSESFLIGANAVYELKNFRHKISYAYGQLTSSASDLEAVFQFLEDPISNFIIPNIGSIEPALRFVNRDIHYSSIGSSYDDGIWLGHTEVAYIDSNSAFFPDMANFYLSIGRRFSNVTLFSMYGFSHTFINKIKIPDARFQNPQIDELRTALDQTLNGNGVDEQSCSLGLRWDFYQNVAFKAQWTHYWLGQNGATLWQKNLTNNNPDQVNVWSFGVDFIF